jgi:hypothetical protein
MFQVSMVMFARALEEMFDRRLRTGEVGFVLKVGTILTIHEITTS